LALDAARPADVTELQKRVVSAAVLAPVALAALYFGGVPFGAFVAAIAMTGLWEWTEIGGGREPLPRFAAIGLLGLALLALATLPPGGALRVVPVAAAAALAVSFFSGRGGWIATGLLYLGIPCAGLILLRGAAPNGGIAILFVLAVVWATDVAAYFGGRAMGGPKLWPRVSPKKTWAGAISGLVAALLAGGLTVMLSGAGSFSVGFLLAAPISVAAQAGDLFESAVKRRFGVKDSGWIIPGHGGVLDRVDGLFGGATLALLLALLGLGGGILTLPAGIFGAGGGL
jgi:phosphatidate cytidylyltransferase